MNLLRRPSRILVPLELPDPDPLPDEVARLLSSVEVVVLGWVETPEQTPPEQAREELEDDGSDALEGEVARLRDAGASVEVHHVFTPALLDSVKRIAEEEACDAALLSAPSISLEHLLVPVRESAPTGMVARLVSDIVGDRKVTLLQLVESDGDEGGEPDWTGLLEEALTDAGVEADQVERRTKAAEDPAATLVEECRSGPCGLIVLAGAGELHEIMFDDFTRQVLEEGGVPVLVLALPED